MSDLLATLEKLSASIDALATRISAIEASVNDSMSRASKAERALFGDAQSTPAPRKMTPAEKGSIKSRALGLG